tara:strand:- start:4835 stop:5047 length:213 start_codon:yes stop_codon:yes gene_type:complete
MIRRHLQLTYPKILNDLGISKSKLLNIGFEIVLITLLKSSSYKYKNAIKILIVILKNRHKVNKLRMKIWK